MKRMKHWKKTVVAICTLSALTFANLSTEPKLVQSAMLDWFRHDVEVEIFVSDPTIPYYWTTKDPTHEAVHYKVEVSLDPGESGRGTLLWGALQYHGDDPEPQQFFDDDGHKPRLFVTELGARMFIEWYCYWNASLAHSQNIAEDRWPDTWRASRDATIFEKPNPESEKLGRIKATEVAHIIGDPRGLWQYIDFNGVEGWVWGKRGKMVPGELLFPGVPAFVKRMGLNVRRRR